MQQLVKNWWERNGRGYQAQFQIPIDILYGPPLTLNEDALELIGPVEGKRVLEIGCGGAQAAIAFAKRGALATGVDIAESQIAFARELAQQHGVTIELLQRDMTDLNPIPSVSQDIVFSAYAFQYIEHLSRCFEEVYRVLKPHGLFVWSVGHPFAELVVADPQTDTLTVTRSYFETGVYIEGADTECPFAGVDHTVSDYFNLLVDVGFVVERMLEPDTRVCGVGDPQHLPNQEKVLAKVPGVIIFKARKPEAS